jgi:hypothetical protein
VLPAPGTMTPALFQRTSSRSSLLRKSSAEALMVERSERSRLRKWRVPFEFGWVDLMELMAEVALDSVRAAT